MNMYEWNDGTSYLVHHGIKGQKWGVRNYQYEDGSLTPEGKKRYGVGDRPSGKFLKPQNSNNSSRPHSRDKKIGSGSSMVSKGKQYGSSSVATNYNSGGGATRYSTNRPFWYKGDSETWKSEVEEIDRRWSNEINELYKKGLYAGVEGIDKDIVALKNALAYTMYQLNQPIPFGTIDSMDEEAKKKRKEVLARIDRGQKEVEELQRKITEKITRKERSDNQANKRNVATRTMENTKEKQQERKNQNLKEKYHITG